MQETEEEKIEEDVQAITYIGEEHTPSDFANSVGVYNWDKDNDTDIAGQKYAGGLKVSISNIFSSVFKFCSIYSRFS